MLLLFILLLMGSPASPLSLSSIKHPDNVDNPDFIEALYLNQSQVASEVVNETILWQYVANQELHQPLIAGEKEARICFNNLCENVSTLIAWSPKNPFITTFKRAQEIYQKYKSLTFRRILRGRHYAVDIPRDEIKIRLYTTSGGNYPVDPIEDALNYVLKPENLPSETNSTVPRSKRSYDPLEETTNYLLRETFHPSPETDSDNTLLSRTRRSRPECNPDDYNAKSSFSATDNTIRIMKSTSANYSDPCINPRSPRIDPTPPRRLSAKEQYDLIREEVKDDEHIMLSMNNKTILRRASVALSYLNPFVNFTEPMDLVTEFQEWDKLVEGKIAEQKRKIAEYEAFITFHAKPDKPVPEMTLKEKIVAFIKAKANFDKHDEKIWEDQRNILQGRIVPLSG